MSLHGDWQRLKMDTKDAQLRRAVRTACNWLKRVRSAAVVRFFERHVVELEKQSRMGDQHGFFQNIKSVQLEETKKVESQCVRDEEGRSCSTIGEGGDTTIPSPGRSPKHLLPGIGIHDPLHGRQACPKSNSFHQGVGQICPR